MGIRIGEQTIDGESSGGGAVTISQITDAGAVGADVLAAETEAEGRDALDVYSEAEVDAAIAGAGGGAQSRTYTLAGGALDYTADAAYAPAAPWAVGGTSLTASSRLGDGTSVPLFSLYGKANVAALARTTVPSLRITAATADTADSWPFNDGGANAVIWLPPDLSDMQIDLTYAGNPDAGGAAGAGEVLRIAASLVQWTTSDARPRAIVNDCVYANNAILTEAWLVDADAGATGSTTRTSTGGVIAMDVRIILRGAEVELWTALSGNALVRRVWRSNPYRRGIRRDMALVLSCAQFTVSPARAGFYAELRALSITGTRASL